MSERSFLACYFGCLVALVLVLVFALTCGCGPAPPAPLDADWHGCPIGKTCPSDGGTR